MSDPGEAIKIPKNCIVFVIKGGLGIPGWSTNDADWGYKVKKENEIVLDPKTGQCHCVASLVN